jgi:hypothetical protein
MTSQLNSVIMQPCVSYWGMHKSARVLDALTSYYFPLYELSYKDFFSYYPVLGLVEALIYQADEAVEASQGKESSPARKNPWVPKKNLIINLLRECNLDHPLIEKHLENLGLYYELESQLMSQVTITYADIIKSAELRTSDVRALHGILLKIANKPYNKNAFELMWPLEVLADIQDDIVQYKDDVEKNCYNIYRMFVKLYGEEATDYLQSELVRYESIFQERLAHLPQDEQEIYLRIASDYEQEHSIKAIPEPILE